MRRPLALPLNVGGNRENIAKLIVSPLALAPSTVTMKLLAVEAGLEAGDRDTSTCVQVVVEPETWTDALAKTVPVED
jgi:hypothetical protein